jgi:hypothetical protein
MGAAMKTFVAYLMLFLFTHNIYAADSPYLFVWAADADKQDSDFLAVLDADPKSSTYGEVLTTIEVGYPIILNTACLKMGNCLSTVFAQAAVM